jgi:hypothetical protein
MLAQTIGRTLGRRARDVVRATALTAFAVGALAGTACSPTETLQVTDPDIINPSEVQSAAGANAVRLGAISRFTSATSGGGEFFMLSGLFADEWINGDSFIARQEIDQRIITPQNGFLTDANRAMYRARLAAEQAAELLEEYSPTAPGWQRAEMHFIQAYVTNALAEHYCNGLTFSTVIDGVEQFGEPITTTAAFERALGNATAGLALVTGTTADDNRVRNALSLVRGRILLNLNRYSDAAAAVAAVPTTFEYLNRHSQTTVSNNIWVLNNLERRYNVANNEGGNGLNFATANDPRVPVCVGGDAACTAIAVTQRVRDDLTGPLNVQRLWPTRESAVSILRGQEARLIEAEAALATNPTAALGFINTARASLAGLAPLTDPGTAAGRVDLLFRERAFWNFGRGARVGDLRRLVRQYNRPANTVFPTGAWHKAGAYGTDVNYPVPLAESNNPNVSASQTCIDRSA